MIKIKKPFRIFSIISLLLGVLYPIFYYIFNNTLEVYVLSPCLFLIAMGIIFLLAESNSNYKFPEKFKIIIEKTNLETGEYQIDKNTLVDTNKSELISYIQSMPIISGNQPITPQIITKDFLIEKYSNNRIIIRWNYISRFISLRKKIKSEIEFTYSSIMRNPTKFYDILLEKVKKIRGGIKFETIIVVGLYALTFASIIVIMGKKSFTFLQYFFLAGFLFIIALGIYYVLSPVIKNDYSKIKIKQHETISNIDPLDATILLYNILIIGINLFVMFYFLVNFTEFSSIIFILYMLYPTIVILVSSSVFFFKNILNNKRLKGRIKDHLNKQIQLTNDYSQKSFYEQLLSKIKTQKIISLPKIRNIIFIISGSIFITTIIISFFF